MVERAGKANSRTCKSIVSSCKSLGVFIYGDSYSLSILHFRIESKEREGVNIMQRDPLVYGIIGVLIGGIIVWFLATNAVNNNMAGMMQMMGMRQMMNQNNSQNNLGMMGNIDRHFIEQMIPHHEDAIIMAELALQKASHQEIKKLAEDIKRTQSEEIEKMKGWYKNWNGADVPTASNQVGMGMGIRMHGGMMGDETDIERLQNTSDFDKAFIEEMIPHHQMAVMMAQMLLRSTNRDEMRKLGQDIIDAQTREINEMRQWYKDWGY